MPQFLLIISPPEPIKKAVEDYKEKLFNSIGNYTSRNSIAHLTLSAFEIEDRWELALIRSLEEIAAEESAFRISICDFQFFKQNCTVYLHVEEKDKFARLSKSLNGKSFIRRIDRNNKRTVSNPHITIGKELYENFQVASNLFQQEKFTGSFTAEAAVLLKRTESGQFELLKEFPFLSRPPRQGMLF